ncbi:MAG: c-type cytochrome, partial [Verrucomicrobiota bacterium]
LLWAASPAPAQTNNVVYNFPDDSLYLHGRYVYQRNCLICHGERGDGKGQMAAGMLPPPRNFTSGIFKYRSTPPGALPTDHDLMRTVRQGISGTSMPIFATLSDRDVRAVTQYIKYFSPKWKQKQNFAAPLDLPDAPDWFFQPAAPAELEKHAAKGKALFAQSCAACHGNEGGGDGPASATLQDAWGNAIKPADLRKPAIRSGPERRDMFRAISTGLSGTPMPSFAETLSEEQRWELIAFIEQLRQEPRAAAGQKADEKQLGN